MECRCTKVMREKALEPGEPPVYHGPGMAPAGKSTMELGYLNQYVKNRGRADDVDHVLLVTLQLRR